MNNLIYILIAGITILIIIAVVLFISRKKSYKLVGTMNIDLNRDDKEICLFTLSMPLVDIQKEQYVLLKVNGNSKLKEWKN